MLNRDPKSERRACGLLVAATRASPSRPTPSKSQRDARFSLPFSRATLAFPGVPGSLVNLVNDRERGVRVAQSDERASLRLDGLHESLELEAP